MMRLHGCSSAAIALTVSVMVAGCGGKESVPGESQEAAPNVAVAPVSALSVQSGLDIRTLLTPDDLGRIVGRPFGPIDIDVEDPGNHSSAKWRDLGDKAGNQYVQLGVYRDVMQIGAMQLTPGADAFAMLRKMPGMKPVPDVGDEACWSPDVMQFAAIRKGWAVVIGMALPGDNGAAAAEIAKLVLARL